VGNILKVCVALLASAVLYGLSAPSASAFPVVAPVIQGAGVVSPVCGQPNVPNGTVLNCPAFATQNAIVLTASGIGQSQFVRWENCPQPSGANCTLPHDGVPFQLFP